MNYTELGNYINYYINSNNKQLIKGESLNKVLTELLDKIQNNEGGGSSSGNLPFSINIENSPMIIHHDFTYHPIVSICDSDGNLCECHVKYNDEHNILVEWNGNLEGKIFLY